MKWIYVYKLIVIAAVCFLSSCAAIPISTALRLSSMSPRALAQIDPAQVRVKLSVPTGFTLNITASSLMLSLTAPSGKRAGKMGLTPLQATEGVRPGGWFSHDVPVTTYLLALNHDGIVKLRELQQFALTSDATNFDFSVQAPFAKFPRDATSVEFWADLRLRASEPFMPLVDGAKLKFPHKPFSG